MVYKTFSQLPTRSSVKSTDFVIADRSDASSSPEARIGVDVLKNYILEGSIGYNAFLEKQQNISILTTSSLIDIKNANSLVLFPSFTKNVYGFFQVRCTSAGANDSLAAIYNLSWKYNENNRIISKNLITNRVLDVKQDSDNDGLSTHHIFIPPFQPLKIGWFNLEIKFTSKITNQYANVDVDIWAFQLK